MVGDKWNQRNTLEAQRRVLANPCAIDIQGLIRFTNDTAYWQAHSFRFIFQNVTSFFKLGGEDVWIYGGTSTGQE